MEKKPSDCIKETVKEGEAFSNPEGAASIVKKIARNSILYTRGKCQIYLKWENIDCAYKHFKGQFITTRMLADFDLVFSKKRRPSNALFFLSLMKAIGFADGEIHGLPYGIQLK